MRADVVGGKLIKDYGLFAVERMATVSKLIEPAVLLDQDVGIPSRSTYSAKI
jgi:hypothetical protein